MADLFEKLSRDEVGRSKLVPCTRRDEADLGKKLARRTDTGGEPPFPLQLEMSSREHAWKLSPFTDLFTSLYGSSKRTYSLFVHVSVCIEYHYLSPSSPLSYLCIAPHCSTSYLYPSLAIRAFHASKSHRTLYTLTTMQFALLSLSPPFPITILSVRFDCSLYSFFFRRERLRDRERASENGFREVDGPRWDRATRGA